MPRPLQESRSTSLGDGGDNRAAHCGKEIATTATARKLLTRGYHHRRISDLGAGLTSAIAPLPHALTGAMLRDLAAG
jgi:hypothetical protein